MWPLLYKRTLRPLHGKDIFKDTLKITGDQMGENFAILSGVVVMTKKYR